MEQENIKKELWVLIIFGSEQVYAFSEKNKAIAYLNYLMSLNLCEEHYNYALKTIQDCQKKYKNYISADYEEEKPYAEIKKVPLNPHYFYSEVEYQNKCFIKIE